MSEKPPVDPQEPILGFVQRLADIPPGSVVFIERKKDGSFFIVASNLDLNNWKSPHGAGPTLNEAVEALDRES